MSEVRDYGAIAAAEVFVALLVAMLAAILYVAVTVILDGAIRRRDKKLERRRFKVKPIHRPQ